MLICEVRVFYTWKRLGLVLQTLESIKVVFLCVFLQDGVLEGVCLEIARCSKCLVCCICGVHM